jgi:hypothetical protein
MLIAGTDEYNGGLITGQDRLDLEGITFEDFASQGVRYEPKSTLFIVTVSETELSCRNAEGEITACRSLTTAQRIVGDNPRARVFLVPVSNGDTLTAVDVVVALLAGIAGVVSERGLIMKEVLYSLINHQGSPRRHRSLLLIGDLSSKVEAMKNMVNDWDMDAEAEPTLDPACWRTAMALARLDKLEPVIGSAQPTSYSSLANALNLTEPATSFRLNSDDLRRVLGTLARRWLGEDHEPVERLGLPDQARGNGFPRHHPVILGRAHSKTNKGIYPALLKAEVLSREDVAGMSCRLVRLPVLNSASRRLRV